MDFYGVLGVIREASDGDIRRAYRRLARQFHPDINPGDRAAAARFLDIAIAYETLVDPDERQRYDRGERRDAAAAPAAGFSGFDFSPRVHAEPTTTFGDLFAGVFTPPADSRPQRGVDVQVAATVTLEEVARGVRHTVTVHRQAACAACAGRGAARTAPTECGACAGAGVIRVVRGHMIFATPCARCAGSGRITATACRDCGGRGVAAQADTVTIDIPPGVPDGAVLQVTGLGHAGRGGGAPGNAQVTVEVAPHPTYRRHGNDLLVEVPVALHEAALGARIALPGLDGAAVRLRVPPGTQSGQRFRLRERGLPAPRGEGRGDLVAEVRLMLPPVLDERSKALLREFGQLQRESVRDARFPSEDGI
ncbi:MAG: J domain-containing protein [Acidobacteriota bacterium]